MMGDCTLLAATPLSADERNGVYWAIFIRRDTRDQFLPWFVAQKIPRPSVGDLSPRASLRSFFSLNFDEIVPLSPRSTSLVSLKSANYLASVRHDVDLNGEVSATRRK